MRRAHGEQAYYAYSPNDLDNAEIMDMEPSTAISQTEVTACKRMIERVQDRFGVWPERLEADTGNDSAEMLAWLIYERDIQPHLPIFDMSVRHDGTVDRADFRYELSEYSYVCAPGNRVDSRNSNFTQPRGDVGKDGHMRMLGHEIIADRAIFITPCPETSDCVASVGLWAVAASRDSSLAASGPGRRKRSSFRKHLRCANSISTSLRCRRDVTAASVRTISRARSRAPSWTARRMQLQAGAEELRLLR